MAIFGKLEKYNGSEDLATWLQKFNRCCAIADKMEDNVRGKLIMLCLTGQPLAVAEQLEHERQGEQTYDQVRIRLESVFESSAKREQRMEAFEKRILLAGESVDQFMLALVQDLEVLRQQSLPDIQGITIESVKTVASQIVRFYQSLDSLNQKVTQVSQTGMWVT